MDNRRVNPLLGRVRRVGPADLGSFLSLCPFQIADVRRLARARLRAQPLDRRCGARPCGPGPLRSSQRGAAAMPPSWRLRARTSRLLAGPSPAAPDCPRAAAVLGAAEAVKRLCPQPCRRHRGCSGMEVHGGGWQGRGGPAWRRLCGAEERSTSGEVRPQGGPSEKP